MSGEYFLDSIETFVPRSKQIPREIPLCSHAVNCVALFRDNEISRIRRPVYAIFFQHFVLNADQFFDFGPLPRKGLPNEF